MRSYFESKLQKIRKIDLLIGSFLLLLIAVTSWTLFRYEFFRVHDYIHGARIAELLRSAQAGHIPVRWTENFGYGYGMPLFSFYAPLPYYVGAFIYWLTGNLVLSSKALFLIANIGAVVGSYLLGKEVYGRKGGVIVAAAYSLAPYRAVNLFVRGAVGESWGMMMMPFALWAGFRILNSKNKTIVNSDWWLLIVSLIGLFLSHNLSTLMYVPVSVIVLGPLAILKWHTNLQILFKKTFSFASAYLLSIGATAFYLFPALLEKDYTIIDNILSGYFYYIHHFLYIRQFLTPNWGYGGSAWGPDDGISFFLGYGQLLAAVLSGLSIVWFAYTLLKKNQSFKKVQKQAVTKIVSTQHFQIFVLSGVVTALALFATLLKSQWFWDTLPLISFIQFPWRWLAIAILFLSLLAGYGMTIIQSKRVLKIVVLLLLAVFALNIQYFQPESYLDRNEDLYYSDEALIRKEMSGILPDYIPKDLQLAILSTAEENTSNSENTEVLLPINENGIIIFNEEAFDETSILVDKPHQKLVSTKDSSSEQLVFAIAWFPGWKAELNGEPTELLKTNHGLIAVDVPEGENQIGVYFGESPVRFWSDLASSFSVLIMLWLLLPKDVLSTKNKK